MEFLHVMVDAMQIMYRCCGYETMGLHYHYSFQQRYLNSFVELKTYYS